MIYFKNGNLFKSSSIALVNTVNVVGVMGKGIALQFKNKFPTNYKKYKEFCNLGNFKGGDIFSIWDENSSLGSRFIINFATKEHWRNPSKYEYIEKGLINLKNLIIDNNIESISIPALGCSNGGLDWKIVKPMIENSLLDIPSNIYIFEPNLNVINEQEKNSLF